MCLIVSSEGEIICRRMEIMCLCCSGRFDRQLLCTAFTLPALSLILINKPCSASPKPRLIHLERSGQAPAECRRAAAGSGRRAQFARLSRSGQSVQHPRGRSVHQPSRQGRSAAHRPGLHGDLCGGKFSWWLAGRDQCLEYKCLFGWLVRWIES